MAGSLDFTSFLETVVEQGIDAARRDYTRPDQRPKLEGSVAGFEACRGLSPAQLARLLVGAKAETARRYRARQDAENYWWARCYEAEVEWVCNVVSAALLNSGHPVIVTPTARGVMKAAEILGVRPSHTRGTTP